VSESSAAVCDSLLGILASISVDGCGLGIRRGGSRANPPEEVLRILELRVGCSDGSGETVGTLRLLNAVVEPGVERVECVVEWVGGEAVSLPW
jgi:hypothetical protein